MDTLLAILHQLRPEVDFEHINNLIDDGHLDSFDIVTLVNDLGEAFEIEIGVEDLVPENFNSVESIWELVQRLQAAL